LFGTTDNAGLGPALLVMQNSGLWPTVLKNGSRLSSAKKTDVQIEVLDGSGKRTRFEDHSVTWEEPQ